MGLMLLANLYLTAIVGNKQQVILQKKAAYVFLEMGRLRDAFFGEKAGPYCNQGHVHDNDCHIKYQEDVNNAIDKMNEQMEVEKQERVYQMKVNSEEERRQMELDVEDGVYGRMLGMFPSWWGDDGPPSV